MAHVLKQEESLRNQHDALVAEERLLQRIRTIEWVLAAALMIAGMVLYTIRGTALFLWLGGAGLFLAVGHHVRILSAHREQIRIRAGRAGETKISDSLAQQLDNATYILNDLIIRHGRDKAQIDHLIVRPNGLFVLETKNWPGHISGSVRDTHWLCHSPHDRRPRRMSNPVRQNRRQAGIVHDRLKETGIRWPDLHPMVVLSSPQSHMENPDHPGVFTPEEAIAFIRQYRPETPYSNDQVQQVINLFMECHA